MCVNELGRITNVYDMKMSKTADASTAPQVYHKAFMLIDPTSSGETSVGGLSRVLATSGLSASTIERVRDLCVCAPGVKINSEFLFSRGYVILGGGIA